MADDIITMYDEDGNDIQFEYLDLIEYGGERYTALLPLEGDPDNLEVLLMQIELGESGDEELVIIEDNDTLDAVYRLFQERNRDRFDFRD